MVEYETFRDPAYYDMWCVREVGSTDFGHGWHLVNGDEAQDLVDTLNHRVPVGEAIVSGLVMVHGRPMSIEEIEGGIAP